MYRQSHQDIVKIEIEIEIIYLRFSKIRDRYACFEIFRDQDWDRRNLVSFRLVCISTGIRIPDEVFSIFYVIQFLANDTFEISEYSLGTSPVNLFVADTLVAQCVYGMNSQNRSLESDTLANPEALDMVVSVHLCSSRWQLHEVWHHYPEAYISAYNQSYRTYSECHGCI